MSSRNSPLAWNLLTHDRRRLALSVAGVAFAVFLMFVQMGFLNGIYDSQTLLLRSLEPGLFMVNREKVAFYPQRPFSMARLKQARGFPGVVDVAPLYMGQAVWKSVPRHRMRALRVLGFDPAHPVLRIPEVAAHLEGLRRHRAVLVDSRSRRFYFGDMLNERDVELNGKKLEVLGGFPVGPNFQGDGHVFTSDLTFADVMSGPGTARVPPQELLDRVEIGLIRLAPGVDANALAERIAAALPKDVQILTQEAIVERERAYWRRTQSVAAVFGLGMIVGFVIGVVICYQILFTDLVDHLPQFATLKAIGYGTGFLTRVVVEQAMYLGLLAFLPGLLASLVAYGLLEHLSGIRMSLTVPREALVAALTLGMCLVSALIAVRKVVTSDPAEVF